MWERRRCWIGEKWWERRSDERRGRTENKVLHIIVKVSFSSTPNSHWFNYQPQLLLFWGEGGGWKYERGLIPASLDSRILLMEE